MLAKGVLRPDDARRAVDHGAAAVVVSNHGARNLDTVPATAEALPRVVDEVGGELPVLVDGGIRRGTDVAKALMLGASAVLVGRPYVWGLAAYGADGVKLAVDMLRTELEMAMGLLGAPTLADLTAGPGLAGLRSATPAGRSSSGDRRRKTAKSGWGQGFPVSSDPLESNTCSKPDRVRRRVSEFSTRARGPTSPTSTLRSTGARVDRDLGRVGPVGG